MSFAIASKTASASAQTVVGNVTWASGHSNASATLNPITGAFALIADGFSSYGALSMTGQVQIFVTLRSARFATLIVVHFVF